MFKELSKDIWADRHTPKNKEIITRNYIKLVEINAAKARSGMPNFVDIEELKSMGAFGLLGAIDKYDPELGFKFETFASRRIYGSIIDGLRSQDWVPRGVRSKQKIVNRAFFDLEEEFLRTPTAAEVGYELDMSEQEVLSIIASIQRGNVLKLDTTLGESEEGTVSYADTLDQTQYDDGSLLEFSDMKNTIIEEIKGLPEKQRIVLTLYYYQGMSLVDISKVFDITQSRVSQLYSKGMKTIYAKLTL